MGGNGLISLNGKTRQVGKGRTAKVPEPKRPPLNLLKLPMDVIFEIFSHVEPLDLLNILETSRTLRTLLMGPSSRVIWKSARANIPGLPDCPDDLNEAEYARLAFESHCQVCGQGKSYELQTIRVWEARARLCNICFDRNFKQEQFRRKNQKSYPNELRELLPNRLRLYHYPSICRSLDELWDKEYKRLTTKKERCRWKDAKIAERRKINAHAEECTAWFATWENVKKRRRKKVAENRKQQIKDRLLELGWENEINNDLLTDRRVRRACERDLTEKALQEVVDYLNGYLEQVKGLRLSSKR